MDTRKLLRSFRFAASGIRFALRREQNMRIHSLAAAAVITAAFLTGLSTIEWVVILILIGGMLALEIMNSAIERAVDLTTPDFHPLAKQAKDMAAGAVLVFAAASAIIGLLIFWPKWF